MRPAGWCWAGLVAGVVAADVALIRKEHATMSEVFGDTLKDHRRWFVMAAWLWLTVHLFGHFVPDRVRKFDPLGPLVELIQPS